MMKRVGAEMVDQWLANLKAENDRVNEAFVKKGMKFYELPDVDKAKWNELAGVPIEKNWITEMEKRGQGENAREFLKRYRALITKYEPKAKYHFIFPK
jgi:TRAP-type C4-dicarboxylate transport system substrate-binding protein